MRLIDADNLDKYDWGHLKEVSKEALFLIETEPTVEAIPVKWIKEWCNTQNGKSLEERLLKRYGVLTLLEDWEKENE